VTDVCARVEPLLSAWIDGELPRREAEQVAVHVDRCPACADEAQRLGAVRSLVRSLPVRRLPDGTRARLDREVAGRPTSRPVTLAGATAAVLVGLLGGAVFALGGQPPSDVRTVSVPIDVYVADHLVHSVHGPIGAPVIVGLRR
jgi:anti-sigma factor RsiW